MNVIIAKEYNNNEKRYNIRPNKYYNFLLYVHFLKCLTPLDRIMTC